MVRDESREYVENDGEGGGQLEGPSHGEDRPLEDSRRPQRLLKEPVEPRHFNEFPHFVSTVHLRNCSTFRWRQFTSLVALFASDHTGAWRVGPSICPFATEGEEDFYRKLEF